MAVYYQWSAWSANLEHASWTGSRSSFSRPCMYTISDQFGQRIGSTPRGMVLGLLEADREFILSLTTVVSELGALFVT